VSVDLSVSVFICIDLVSVSEGHEDGCGCGKLCEILLWKNSQKTCGCTSQVAEMFESVRLYLRDVEMSVTAGVCRMQRCVHQLLSLFEGC
jgi:hypothetical protein